MDYMDYYLALTSKSPIPEGYRNSAVLDALICLKMLGYEQGEGTAKAQKDLQLAEGKTPWAPGNFDDVAEHVWNYGGYDGSCMALNYQSPLFKDTKTERMDI